MITSEPNFCKYLKIVYIGKNEWFEESIINICTYDKQEEIISILKDCHKCKNKCPLNIEDK